ncbi:MAG: penicillin-binding protein 2 [Veillonellales bacterium]
MERLRIGKLLLFFLLISTLLIGRLFYLQIFTGQRLAVLGLSSRVQEIPVEVARGEIVDRNGVPLTNTTQRFSIVVFPAQVQDMNTTAGSLADITGQDPQRIAARISEHGSPFKLKTDIDLLTAKKINGLNIPGVVAVTEKLRYGYSSLAAHITGYINTADNKGVSGIEAMYDDVLRGNQPEYAAALVDAGQQIIPGLGYKRMRFLNGSGPNNVVLTLDTHIQKIVEESMDRHMKMGAVIVLRSATGEVLAMASRPNFDANYIDEYLSHDSAPLLNRAVSAFQPGSVFKLAVAAAALENELVRPNEIFYDPGYIDVNKLRFNGWDFDRGGRGRLTFTEAMAYSSNPVFIEVGLRLGGERLVSFAQKLGFGHRTKLDFDGEAEGNLPSPENLYPGELANFAIGQGTLEASPIQMASLVATIANNGVKVDPYLVGKITNSAGVVIHNDHVSQGTRVLSKQTAKEIREMMTAVTHYGTGQAAYVENYGSAGKTGSAETGRQNSRGQGINHAWFAGYAPLNNPQYVMVVLVEEGMSGGDVAAPIFREIMTAILSQS